MDDGFAARQFLRGAFLIQVNPLGFRFTSDFCKGVDPRLVDFEPTTDADFVADMAEQIVGMGKLHCN